MRGEIPKFIRVNFILFGSRILGVYPKLIFDQTTNGITIVLQIAYYANPAEIGYILKFGVFPVFIFPKNFSSKLKSDLVLLSKANGSTPTVVIKFRRRLSMLGVKAL